MSYPRRSRFDFGGSTWITELPAGAWNALDESRGYPRRITSSGVPAADVIGREVLLELPLRVRESEYRNLLALVRYGQTCEPFTWYPDADDARSFSVYLEEPAAGGEWQPTRMSDYPRVWDMTLLLRGSEDEGPWVRYFEVAEPVDVLPSQPDPPFIPTPEPPPEPGPEPEPEPPVPPDPEDPPEPPDPELGVLFFDDYSTGARAGAQNGVAYGGVNTGGPDDVAIVADAGNPGGSALGFLFAGNLSQTDDAWAEQRMTFPDATQLYLEMRLAIPANYFHRNSTGPDNNKGLRLWDERYGGTPTHPTWRSMVHVGYSFLPLDDGTGRSQLIIEYTDATGGGNHNTGPWTRLFSPGLVYDIGFEVTCASGIGVADGRIRAWINNALVYDRSNLTLCRASDAPGAANVIRHGYLLGWSNSGFDVDTTIKLRRLIVAPARVVV